MRLSDGNGAIDWISKQVAAARGEDEAKAALRIAQRLSATLQRENARAILRRSPQPADPSAQTSAWEQANADLEA